MSQAVLKDPEYTAIIRDQYADASPDAIMAWARRWGVSRDSIRHRAAQLGVRRSREAKEAALSKGQHERNGSSASWEAPSLNRDDEHVAACIAQGGFPVVVWINGQPRTVYRREWAQ
jgi:hypothetical protein